ncbi:nucleotide sugar dehydrogenase [Rhodovulum adriaticum]|uniref:UDP-N-acetyl-D-galactosamine dehydrogenase n=1 Tax=Rhodovulum adriaticum TaxID=35804 RepID=A0A4R2NH36_RHOAD|nr:nucleotide sugar dehydrogenase [Rhodovulum adriaticum]MBK1636534.1 Vi polysaccharide biosynthesis protein VipA/TviB [Rhodovulum adriaticum]TCP20759.1 UDP-N-acetyl-D-galactosamine dehydrogenase [Rhodovulum adriaticum]
MTCLPEDPRIAIIGLGYVGLPLAAAFAQAYPVVGFDIDPMRIKELEAGRDRTRELTDAELAEAVASGLRFTDDLAALDGCNTFIVTVPTPIDAHRRPDLRPLLSASETVGRIIRPGSVVVFESTVYPGATEEDCIPVIERVSGLKYNEDFFGGYSPERINPGDREHRVADIVKVTSGSTPEAADFVDALYARIIKAGTHKAESIAVAEAAKVIENTQRDVNIALVNELAIVFERLGLDTEAVLTAAGTKWNFLPFRPGLVGGHCIGVDPYYLTHKAQEVGHHPEMILAGRRLNDGMGAHVADRVAKGMIRRGMCLPQSRVLILGLAFKENTPDLRNTRVVDIVDALSEYGVSVDIHDPEVDAAEAKQEYGLVLVPHPEPKSYDAVILAVAHKCFVDGGAAKLRAWMKPDGYLFDVKYGLPAASVDARL